MIVKLNIFIMKAREFLIQVVDFLNVVMGLTPVKGKVRPTFRMTANQLMDFMNAWNFGSQPASVQYVTEPALLAGAKDAFGSVSKVGAVQCLIGYDYEKSVIAQREREGVANPADFQAESLWNGYGIVLNSRLAKRKVTKVRQKNGEKFREETGEVIYYLRYKHTNTLKALHFDSVLNFIPTALLKPYFKPYYAPKKQELEKVIKPRTLKIENVRRLRFKGMEIQVIPG